MEIESNAVPVASNLQCFETLFLEFSSTDSFSIESLLFKERKHFVDSSYLMLLHSF